jgi:SPX domain protein involved in polyphosphate accumulation
MSVEEFESKLDKVIKINNPNAWHRVDVPVTHPIRNTA